ECQYGRGCECLFKLIESFLFFGAPMPDKVLFGEIVQRSRDFCEVFNKPSVEIT
ncbi:hypothetical protein SERLA73DRAFT_67249, partial [Serpula lacrymans var. lacrymans S7.3]